MEKITESDSVYHHLEKMSVDELLVCINSEDQKVAAVVAKAIPQISRLVNKIADKLQAGGRLFYIGAGTSGRLGVLDASECPPTFGVEASLVNGIIAGGDAAIRQAVEFAEDNENQGWKDLTEKKVNPADVVIGVSAGGSAAYVAGALKNCRLNGITTGCITCNPGTTIKDLSDFPVEVVVGPEFISGSTRMKAGTAQKMVLNMISTSVMIKLGRVEDNKMVNMQLSNEKLLDRGVKIIMDKLGIADYNYVKGLLLTHGSVKKMLENYQL